jgi:hypothetical protein
MPSARHSNRRRALDGSTRKPLVNAGNKEARLSLQYWPSSTGSKLRGKSKSNHEVCRRFLGGTEICDARAH